MKSLRTLRFAALAAAVAGAAVVSTPAVAEVSATAGVANIYLFRGLDLGAGTPAVSGSLDYNHSSGLFAGIWASSGDSSWGSETDLYAGYAYSSDAFGLKAGVYKYTYRDPDLDYAELGLNFTAGSFFADAYLGIDETGPSSAPVDNKNNYYDVGYTYEKYTLKYGMTDNDALDTDYSHLDLTYAYNDNLSFTLSGVVDADDSSLAAGGKDPLFVVSYKLPLDLPAAK